MPDLADQFTKTRVAGVLLTLLLSLRRRWQPAEGHVSSCGATHRAGVVKGVYGSATCSPFCTSSRHTQQERSSRKLLHVVHHPAGGVVVDMIRARCHPLWPHAASVPQTRAGSSVPAERCACRRRSSSLAEPAAGGRVVLVALAAVMKLFTVGWAFSMDGMPFIVAQ